jgi:hypothetical protein
MYQSYGVDIQDPEVFKYFEAENISSLDELYGFLKSDKAYLVLLPVTPPKGANLGKEHRAALASLNTTFRKYASSHPGVYFFDVQSYLNKFDASEVFIDSCCHLSENGAELQAGFILEQLKAANLFKAHGLNQQIKPMH